MGLWEGGLRTAADGQLWATTTRENFSPSSAQRGCQQLAARLWGRGRGREVGSGLGRSYR